MMNGNGRASSVSPSISSSNESGRGVRPPPPVRPKPKRTITAPILTTGGADISVFDEKKGVTELRQDIARTEAISTTSLPTKGTVKALAERFDVTRGPQISPSSGSIVKATAEIFEANGASQGSKLQRISPAGGSSSAVLRFVKPSPPGRRQTTSLIGDLTISKQNENEVFLRPHSGSALASVDKKRGSLERRRRLKGAQRKRNGDNDVTTPSIGGSRNEGAVKIVSYRKNSHPKRSRSCDVTFDRISTKSWANDLKAKHENRDRRNSMDGSEISAYFYGKTDRLTLSAAKKAPAPAVPPKPIKKPTLTPSPMHEYAVYDVLPSGPPSICVSALSNPSQKQPEEKRRSLPGDRPLRQLSGTPTSDSYAPQYYDTPARLSLSTPPSVSSTLSTMELYNSQLNISGHIYCAVRHGEVIEDDWDILNHVSSIDSKDLEDDADTSFSAAVFGAIEQATGRRIALDEDGNRLVEEDAITNYEEIMEDLPVTEPKIESEQKAPPPKLPLRFRCDEKMLVDQSNKWETCSSLTSTSADSGSSFTNAHAPTLISFRRRSSNERQDEKDMTITAAKRITGSSLMEDSLHPIDDPTPTQNVKSYSPLVAEKREKESKSASRSGNRQTRPKSQLDLAANSLWRIKSDIQLNLSQAMGKIRLKVSSSGSSIPPANSDGQPPHSARSSDTHQTLSSVDAGAAKKNEQKARSTFYLPTANAAENKTQALDLPPHPTSISITLEAGLGDDMVSSTAASSDDDDDDDDWDDTFIAGQIVRNSNDSEQTTPTAAGNLPDLVPHGLVKQGTTGQGQPHQSFRDDDAATTDSSSPTTTTTDGTISNSSIPLFAQEPNRPPLLSEMSCSSTQASGIGELERFELVYNSRFAFSEPLYQHYRSQTALVQRNQTFSEGDGKGTISRREKLLNTSQLGSQRTLWCELPEVQGAGLLQRMGDEERKLQEAMFEVITSEASYLRSLNILITQFMASPQLSGNTALGSCISKQERKQLFSNILCVRDCSERLLCALESRLEENVLLEDVCDLLYEHLRRDCEVYVKYCANQIYQERTLNDLRRLNAEFRQVVGQLETNPVCECLNLRSFLMLPMQRVTRYPLLVAAILQRTEEGSQRQVTAQRAYGMAGRVVRQCNEGAKRLERIEQLVELDQTLLYREGGPKRVAFVSGSRWLIKKGAVTHLLPRRHTLGVRGGLRHRRVYLFLFTDLLLITKPVDGDKRFVVKDYCQRQFVEVAPLEPSCPQVPEGASLPSNCCLILCTLMKNHRGRQVDLVFNCESETDKTRWLEAVRPASAKEDGAERIYEPWDCPQVRVLTEYHAIQEDELDLEVGEIINVLRKMPDGWYEGERLRDSEKGWFLGNLTEEILSDHIRAKNYRDRLRFINEAEMIQRSIYTGDSGAPISLPPSSSGTNSRRSSIIPTAAKALFRF